MNDNSQTTTVTIERPNPAALLADADSRYELAEQIVIDGDATLVLVTEELRDLKARIAQLEERRKAITRPLDQAKAATMELFRPAIDRLTEGRRKFEAAILTYQTEQDRKRREEQARLEAAARAERERAEAAARAQAEEAARLAAAAAQAADAAEAAKLAERAQQAQENAAAAEVAAASVVAPAASVEAPKVAGLGTRGTLEVELVDKLAFVRHVAANPSLIHLVMEDSVKLRAYARALGDGAQIPGVRVGVKKTVTTRKVA